MVMKCTGMVAVLMTAADSTPLSDIAELAVNQRQLGTHADDAEVGELTACTAAEVLGLAHHARANARFLLCGIDRQHSDVDAVAIELHVDSGDDCVIVASAKEMGRDLGVRGFALRRCGRRF